jgi:hypothetical protein
MRWVGYVARMGEEECIQGVGGKARRKETIWDGMYWINLAQDRDQCWALLKTVMNVRLT